MYRKEKNGKRKERELKKKKKRKRKKKLFGRRRRKVENKKKRRTREKREKQIITITKWDRRRRNHASGTEGIAGTYYIGMYHSFGGKTSLPIHGPRVLIETCPSHLRLLWTFGLCDVFLSCILTCPYLYCPYRTCLYVSTVVPSLLLIIITMWGNSLHAHTHTLLLKKEQTYKTRLPTPSFPPYKHKTGTLSTDKVAVLIGQEINSRLQTEEDNNNNNTRTP